METFDHIDTQILATLQRDAAISLEDLGEKVGLSRNACWRRLKTLEAKGAIKARVALLDSAVLGRPLTVFVQVRTSQHEKDWLTRFARATALVPEITGVYTMTGDLDYLIRIKARDVADYDRIYQSLIDKVPLHDVSASFVMEEIKDTHEVPLP